MVDILSFHYLATHDDATWLPVLEGLRRDWLGRGRVRGLWATEELGSGLSQENRGAGATLKVLARYLHWWSTNRLSASKSRAFFWGWTTGSGEATGGAALEVLWEFLGDTALRELEGLVSTLDGDLEQYAFQSKSDPTQRIAIVMPAPTASSDGLGLTAPLRVSAQGWRSKAAFEVHVWQRDRHEVYAPPAALPSQNGVYSLQLPESVVLEPNDALLVLMRR